MAACRSEFPFALCQWVRIWLSTPRVGIGWLGTFSLLRAQGLKPMYHMRANWWDVTKRLCLIQAGICALELLILPEMPNSLQKKLAIVSFCSSSVFMDLFCPSAHDFAKSGGHSESVLILSICRHRPEHAKSMSLHMWCCSIQKTKISPNCRCLKIPMSICSTEPNQKPIHPAFMHDWFYFPYIATSTNSVHGTVIPTPR